MDKLGLIVLNYNSFNDTIVCVDRLLKFQEAYKIVIVDNQSPDGSYDKLKQYYMNQQEVDVILSDDNRGYSAGNNFGIKYALKKHRVTRIGILNPDVIIDDKALIKNMLQYLDSSEKFVIIGGLPVDADGAQDINKAAWNIPSALDLVLDHSLLIARKKTLKQEEIGEHLISVDCVAGCFFLVKVSFLESIGFLDEGVFLYNEENLLGIQCKKRGLIEVVYTDGKYIHNHRHTSRNIPLRKKVNATHHSYMSRKYLCKRYYSKCLLPFLWMVEMVNKFFLMLCYVKSRLIK